MAAHHHHHHHLPAGERGLLVAVAVNVVLTLVQIVGGVLSGSLALIADAIHNLSDALSLALAAWARRVARRPRSAEMTFGWSRAEILAALVNYVALMVIGLYLVLEAMVRLLDPPPVEGWTVVGIGSLALLVDAVTALLTWRLARESVNIRAAFMHNLADALGSVAVILGGAAILIKGWWLVDPLVTLLIAGYILWMGVGETRPLLRILMQATPEGLDPEAVARAMAEMEGVRSVHHVHLWQLDEHQRHAEAHVVAEPEALVEGAGLRRRLRELLRERFDIGHVTLELEPPGEACDTPPLATRGQSSSAAGITGKNAPRERSPNHRTSA